MRVLVTGCGGPAGRSLAKQFAELDHTVYGVDMEPQENPAFASITAVPAASHPEFLPELTSVVRNLRIDLVIPTVSEELPLIAEYVETANWGADTMISDSGPVRTADDKYLTMAHSRAAGVGVPLFALPSDFSRTSEALDFAGGAVVLKPRIGRGGRGVRVIEEEWDVDWSALDDSLILQEYIPGAEYAPMVFQPTTRREEPIVIVVEKRSWREGRIGNATSVARLADDEAPDVSALALSATAALGLHGPVDLDIRRRKDGTPVVLEVNARFGANSAAAPEILLAALAEAELHVRRRPEPRREADERAELGSRV